MVSGGSDNTVRVWDAATHSEVLQLGGHRSDVYGVGFCFDDKNVLSCSSDGREKGVPCESLTTLLPSIRSHFITG